MIYDGQFWAGNDGGVWKPAADLAHARPAGPT